MQATEARSQENKLAADFKLKDLNNLSHTLSSYKNKKAVLLFFWTTWCPFCRNELRSLNAIYPKLKKEGWEVFGIDVAESAHKVKKFIKQYSLDFKILLDKDRSTAQSYNIIGVPTFILVDKNGRIVFKGNRFPQTRYKDLISS